MVTIWSGYVSGQSVIKDQPVQFSLAHHVGSMGIDCRHCHTTVEESRFANIPPTKTCTNCHSQIWSNAPILEPVRASFRENRPLEWQRVHDLPDFVYLTQYCALRGSAARRATGPSTDAADVPGGQPADAVVPGLPSEPRELRPPEGPVFNMAYQRPADDPVSANGWFGNTRSGTRALTSCSICHR